MSSLADIANKVLEIGGAAIVDPILSVKGKYKTINEEGEYEALDINDVVSSLFDVTIGNSTEDSIDERNYSIKKQEIKIEFNKQNIRTFLTNLNVEVNNTIINSFIILLKQGIKNKHTLSNGNSKIFQEYSIDYKTPFSLQEQSGYNFGLTDFYDIKPSYNFYESKYENILSNLDEKIIPNLYYSQIQDFGYDHTYLRYSTASGQKKYYVKSQDYKNGFYFDSWSSNIRNLTTVFSTNDLNKLKQPATYVAINNDFSFISDSENKRENFPFYNKIEFTTDNGSIGINKIIKDIELNCSVINTCVKQGLLTILSPFTNSVGGEVTLSKNIIQSNLFTVGDNGEPLIQYNYQTSSFIGLELQFENIMSSSIYDGSKPRVNAIPLISYLDKCNEDDTRNVFDNIILDTLTKIKLAELANQNVRSYEDIYNNLLAKNETLLYSIKKSSNNLPIQNIVFLNPLEAKNFLYFDTQIKYETNYKYEVDAYQAVIGTDYYFDTYSETNQTLSFYCKYKPTIKLIQTRYFDKEIINTDTPPIPLDVQFIPYFGINNKLSLFMNSQVGKQIVNPIQILDEDAQVFDLVRKNQEVPTGPILFESESPSRSFQIFRLEQKPTSYSDFKNGILEDINLL
jgi:hypothetical protein